MKYLLALMLLSSSVFAEAPKAQLKVIASAPALQESAGAESPSFESNNAGKTFYLGLIPHEKTESAIKSEVGDDVKNLFL